MTDPTLADMRQTCTRILAATPEQHITIDPRGLAAGVIGLVDEIEDGRETIRLVKGQRDRAEASLARVTDDSMAERIKGVLDAEGAMYCTRFWEAWGYGTMQSGDFEPMSQDDGAVQAFINAIRAVAADEQEKTDD